ncbi:hypothetical protein NDU88_012088 [Pleurodeles waltl]|uniref:Uncharacterized protein n=1 Tax=Pleurodeles waltl TaxID=8319 RepID=A0AAV7S5I5_PLEWA|nr:hypothetical protein NDU88_012088 [Pleurodeles waltl]
MNKDKGRGRRTLQAFVPGGSRFVAGFAANDADETRSLGASKRARSKDEGVPPPARDTPACLRCITRPGLRESAGSRPPGGPREAEGRPRDPGERLRGDRGGPRDRLRGDPGRGRKPRGTSGLLGEATQPPVDVRGSHELRFKGFRDSGRREAIAAVQALRSSVNRVFDCLKDGLRSKGAWRSAINQWETIRESPSPQQRPVEPRPSAGRNFSVQSVSSGLFRIQLVDQGSRIKDLGCSAVRLGSPQLAAVVGCLLKTCWEDYNTQNLLGFLCTKWRGSTVTPPRAPKLQQGKPHCGTRAGGPSVAFRDLKRLDWVWDSA